MTEQQRGKVVTKFGIHQQPSSSGTFAHLDLGSLTVSSLTAYNQVIKNTTTVSELQTVQSISANSISSVSISGTSLTADSISAAGITGDSISAGSLSLSAFKISISGILVGNGPSANVSAIAFTSSNDYLRGDGSFATFNHDSTLNKSGIGSQYFHLNISEYSSVTSLSATISSITSDISSLSSSITGFNDQILSLSSSVTSLSATVTSHTEQINTLSAALTSSITSSHPELKLLTPNGLSLTSLTQELSLGLASASTTGALKSEDWIIFSSVTSVSADLNSLSSSVTSLSATVTGHTVQINSLSGTVTGLQSVTGSFVPYIGATTNVNLAAYSLTSNTLSAQSLTSANFGITGGNFSFDFTAITGGVSATQVIDNTYGGYSGTSITHAIRIYGFINAPSGRIYTANYIQSDIFTLSSGSDYYYINYNWNPIPLVDGYVILDNDSYNGYNYDYALESINSSLHDVGYDWTPSFTTSPTSGTEAFGHVDGKFTALTLSSDVIYSNTGFISYFPETQITSLTSYDLSISGGRIFNELGSAISISSNESTSIIITAGSSTATNGANIILQPGTGSANGSVSFQGIIEQDMAPAPNNWAAGFYNSSSAGYGVIIIGGSTVNPVLQLEDYNQNKNTVFFGNGDFLTNGTIQIGLTAISSTISAIPGYLQFSRGIQALSGITGVRFYATSATPTSTNELTSKSYVDASLTSVTLPTPNRVIFCDSTLTGNIFPGYSDWNIAKATALSLSSDLTHPVWVRRYSNADGTVFSLSADTVESLHEIGIIVLDGIDEIFNSISAASITANNFGPFTVSSMTANSLSAFSLTCDNISSTSIEASISAASQPYLDTYFCSTGFAVSVKPYYIAADLQTCINDAYTDGKNKVKILSDINFSGRVTLKNRVNIDAKGYALKCGFKDDSTVSAYIEAKSIIGVGNGTDGIACTQANSDLTVIADYIQGSTAATFSRIGSGILITLGSLKLYAGTVSGSQTGSGILQQGGTLIIYEANCVGGDSAPASFNHTNGITYYKSGTIFNAESNSACTVLIGSTGVCFGNVIIYNSLSGVSISSASAFDVYSYGTLIANTDKSNTINIKGGTMIVDSSIIRPFI